MTTEQAVIAALRLKIALNTDALTEHTGRKLGLPETEWILARFKARVYRAAVKLEANGQLASSKTFNGKVYERYWRINKVASAFGTQR